MTRDERDYKNRLAELGFRPSSNDLAAFEREPAPLRPSRRWRGE